MRPSQIFFIIVTLALVLNIEADLFSSFNPESISSSPTPSDDKGFDLPRKIKDNFMKVFPSTNANSPSDEKRDPKSKPMGMNMDPFHIFSPNPSTNMQPNRQPSTQKGSPIPSTFMHRDRQPSTPSGSPIPSTFMHRDRQPSTHRGHRDRQPSTHRGHRDRQPSTHRGSPIPSTFMHRDRQPSTHRGSPYPRTNMHPNRQPATPGGTGDPDTYVPPERESLTKRGSPMAAKTPNPASEMAPSNGKTRTSKEYRRSRSNYRAPVTGPSPSYKIDHTEIHN